MHFERYNNPAVNRQNEEIASSNQMQIVLAETHGEDIGDFIDHPQKHSVDLLLTILSF